MNYKTPPFLLTGARPEDSVSGISNYSMFLKCGVLKYEDLKGFISSLLSQPHLDTVKAALASRIWCILTSPSSSSSDELKMYIDHLLASKQEIGLCFIAYTLMRPDIFDPFEFSLDFIGYDDFSDACVILFLQEATEEWCGAPKSEVIFIYYRLVHELPYGLSSMLYLVIQPYLSLPLSEIWRTNLRFLEDGQIGGMIVVSLLKSFIAERNENNLHFWLKALSEHRELIESYLECDDSVVSLCAEKLLEIAL